MCNCDCALKERARIAEWLREREPDANTKSYGWHHDENDFEKLASLNSEEARVFRWICDNAVDPMEGPWLVSWKVLPTLRKQGVAESLCRKGVLTQARKRSQYYVIDYGAYAALNTDKYEWSDAIASGAHWE